jgi:hypothetical protein
MDCLSLLVFLRLEYPTPLLVLGGVKMDSAHSGDISPSGDNFSEKAMLPLISIRIVYL